MLALWKHQQEALDAINNSFEDNDRCLLKMFCGTGKTRVILSLILEMKRNLSVVIFPSIALVQQFDRDYLQQFPDLLNGYKTLKVCSLAEVGYTTDPDELQNFIEENHDELKIIAITYQSFSLLKDLSIMKADIMVFDEAHHVVGNEIQNLVFGSGIIADKTLFATATPKNDNGIEMTGENGDCGSLVYEYTHRQAVEDGICNDIEIVVSTSPSSSSEYFVNQIHLGSHRQECIGD